VRVCDACAVRHSMDDEPPPRDEAGADPAPAFAPPLAGSEAFRAASEVLEALLSH